MQQRLDKIMQLNNVQAAGQSFQGHLKNGLERSKGELAHFSSWTSYCDSDNGSLNDLTQGPRHLQR